MGLLFMYGATGSGKSYTMSGEALSEPGIIPRTFDVLFNTLRKNLLPPGSFVPDSCNGFKPAHVWQPPSQALLR
jgi:kinesin family protein 23